MAWTMLIHANKWWPDSVTANLGPYAVRAANDAIAKVYAKPSGKRQKKPDGKIHQVKSCVKRKTLEAIWMPSICS